VDVVQRVARGALHDLQQARLRVQIDDVAEGTGACGLFDKTRGSHRRQGPIRYLLEGPADAGPIAKKHTDPQHAFPPDRGHFHEQALAHFVGDGEHTAIREVDVLNARAVRMQRMTGRDGGHPHVLENAVVLGAWQCGQEPIVKRTSVRQPTERRCSCAGHGFSSEQA